MSAPQSLPAEYVEKVAEINGLLHKVQKKMVAAKGEADLDGIPAVFGETLERKSNALGHIREHLQKVPDRVAEEFAQRSSS